MLPRYKKHSFILCDGPAFRIPFFPFFFVLPSLAYECCSASLGF